MNAESISKIVEAFWPIVAFLSAGIFASILWCAKVQYELAQHGKSIAQMEDAHVRDLIQIKLEHEKTQTGMWQKLDGFQGLLNGILTGLGEIKGRMDARGRD